MVATSHGRDSQRGSEVARAGCVLGVWARSSTEEEAGVAVVVPAPTLHS